MRCQQSIDQIIRRHFPRGGLSPIARSITETLGSGRSALLVSPDATERELATELAVVVGRSPVLIVAPSDRGLDRRAEELTAQFDRISCHIHAQLTDGALDVLSQQLAAGRWDAGFVSCRSLSDPRLMRAARAFAPRMLVLEAAHRLAVHSRQYDLAWLHAKTLACEAPSVLALSCVAGTDAREDIAEQLNVNTRDVFLGGLDRPELRIEVRRVPNQPQKDAHLLGLFLDPPHRAIIYVDEHVEAERLAALIREERGFDALEITNLGPQEFGAALRRFREGGLRVLVTTGVLDPTRDWPEIPVVANIGLPESLEMLHRRLHTASGGGSRFVLIHEEDDEDEEEWPPLERRALSAAPDIGQMLALHAAAAGGERISYLRLSRRTGLHPEQIALGLEALIHAGTLDPLARGDDWLKAEAGDPLSSRVLERWGRCASAIRHARLAGVRQIREFAAARGCRREALAEALDYPLTASECCCDRCRRRAPVRISGRIPGGYPLRTGDFRGWALALYRRPGEDAPTEGPGMLIERLKYDGEEGCGRRLAWLMHKRVRESRTYRDCDVIVAVPASLADSEDSPAGQLAREIGRLCDMPVADVLHPAKDRLPQKELTSESAKRRNIRGAFAMESVEPIEGSIVLLVDDIYDSGATMQEAAVTLMRAGARDVRMLAAVRTAFGRRRNT